LNLDNGTHFPLLQIQLYCIVSKTIVLYQIRLYCFKYNCIQYNTISFTADDKNKDREVSADTAATETYYMMGIIKI